MSDFLAAAKALLPARSLTIDGLEFGPVTLRGLSAKDISDAQKRATTQVRGAAPAVDSVKMLAVMIARSLYGPDGERLIPADREHEVGDLPQQLLLRLQKEVLAINGLDGADAEGNFGETTGGVSSSA